MVASTQLRGYATSLGSGWIRRRSVGGWFNLILWHLVVLFVEHRRADFRICTLLANNVNQIGTRQLNLRIATQLIELFQVCAGHNAYSLKNGWLLTVIIHHSNCNDGTRRVLG